MTVSSRLMPPNASATMLLRAPLPELAGGALEVSLGFTPTWCHQVGALVKPSDSDVPLRLKLTDDLMHKGNRRTWARCSTSRAAPWSAARTAS